MDLHATLDAAESVAKASSREPRGSLATVYAVREHGRVVGWLVRGGESPSTDFVAGWLLIPVASWRDGLPRLPWLPEQRNGGPRRADSLVLARASKKLADEIRQSKRRRKPAPEG